MWIHFSWTNNISAPVTMRLSDCALLKPNIASALGSISQLFLAFVPNLFVAWAKWANVLVGLSAFMGTAPGDINSHCSCKAAQFAQLDALVRPQQVQSVANCCSHGHTSLRLVTLIQTSLRNHRTRLSKQKVVWGPILGSRYQFSINSKVEGVYMSTQFHF